MKIFLISLIFIGFAVLISIGGIVIINTFINKKNNKNVKKISKRRTDSK